MAEVHPFVFNNFFQNTYVIQDNTNEAVLIDPGCYTPEEKKILAKYFEENGINFIPISLKDEDNVVEDDDVLIEF